MVGNAYDTLLEELARELKIKQLKADDNNSCLIKLKDGCEIQIEPDERGENIILGTMIAQIPSGAYRANVFKEALKTNGLPPPRPGIFAWSDTADRLILFRILPIKQLTGSKVAEAIYPFAAVAIKWKETIASGQVPKVESGAITGGATAGGIFGLRP